MKILAFTGMPASGKSVAVQIANEYKIPVIRMGDAVWEETKKQGLVLNDKNVGKTANDMREKYGKDIWAKKTIEKIKTSFGREKRVVIDGIRNSEEIDLFKKELGNDFIVIDTPPFVNIVDPVKELGNDFIVIAISASEEIRRKRILARRREDDSIDVRDLEDRDRRELGWGLGEVIEHADVEIVNEGTKEEFREAVREIFESL